MKLPLYTSTSTPIDDTEATHADPLCRRCDLGAAVEVACLSPAGEPGGVLLLGQAPTRKGHDTGRPWSNATERKLARLVKQFTGHDTPVAFDYAIKCPGSTAQDSIDACRGHLRATLDAVKPERIIAFGGAAAKALTGAGVPTGKVRKCWSRLGDGTPVLYMPEPYHVQANRILAQWFREDLEWAVTVDTASLVAPTEAEYTVVETEAEARRCYEHIAEGLHVFDVETYGKLNEPDFKIVSLASVRGGETNAWVWPEESLREGDPRRPWVERLLRDAQHVAHNAKYEHRSVLCHFGIDMGADATAVDTMISAKLLRADGLVGLDPLANLVGMGGHKAEAKEELAQKVKVLRALRRAADKDVPVKVETQTRVSPKTGKTQKRKVVVESRAPTQAERREQVIAAWAKPRTIGGERSTYAAQAKQLRDWDAQALLVDCPKITADWLHASLARGGEMSYAYGLIDRDVCHRYNALDTVSTSLLAAKLTPEVYDVQSFADVYDSHLGRAPWAVGWVETWGIKVDRTRLAELEVFFNETEAQLLAKIHAHKPGLNPGSTDQLAQFLFKDLKLRPLKTSQKTGKPSTDKVTLEHLRDSHPAIPLIQQWKSITKLNGTYARGLRGFICGDGRIRAHFNITGTETGRMSCSDPNMQTIPSRGEYAKRVKDVFVATAGYKLVQLDYKALEVRIAAMLSQDPVLLDVFARGGDPHRETAEAISEILWVTSFADCGGLTGDALAKEQKRRRDVCKTIVFGTLYGQGPAALAQGAGISEDEATRAQTAVLGRYRVLQKWIEKTAHKAARSGETWTWWAGARGRRRSVPDIGSTDNAVAGHGTRQSYNTPVQGTGSEFCLASLVQLVEWIHSDCIDAKLVMTVHDSLIFEVYEDDVPELVEQATRIMTSHESGGVLLDVDVEWGDSWGALEAYEMPEAA